LTCPDTPFLQSLFRQFFWSQPGNSNLSVDFNSVDLNGLNCPNSSMVYKSITLFNLKTCQDSIGTTWWVFYKPRQIFTRILTWKGKIIQSNIALESYFKCSVIVTYVIRSFHTNTVPRQKFANFSHFFTRHPIEIVPIPSFQCYGNLV